MKTRNGPVCVLVSGVVVVVGCAASPHGEHAAVIEAPAAGDLARTAGPPLRFTDVTAEAGITHRHRQPILDHQLDNIMSWMCSVGAAAAAGDYDGDGWIDLYLTSSRKGTPNALYRNNRDGTFTDVAAQAGLADLNGAEGVSMDAVWGDCDADGDDDLYLVRWGRDALFRNEGDGTFTDVTAESFSNRDGSSGTTWANGNAAIFFDFDLDGRLDLYVGNYFDEVDLWHLESTRVMHDDFETARNGGVNFLYHQEPDGTFTEVAAQLGVDDPGWTLAAGAADVDNDGWPDLYCANDFGPDQLFRNARDGTFVNITEDAIGSDTKKGMNVDFGDFNNDGWLDIYVANITTVEYLQEGNMLWHNNGPGPDGTVTLTDISLETGTYDGGWGWGAKFFDGDNDGDLDLIAVNGFISAGEGNYWYDLASWTVTGEESADARNWPAIGDRSFSGYEPYRFWRNDGSYAFTQVARDAGLDSDRDGRGVVCFDYDNDGDVDLFVANQEAAPHLFRNDSIDGSPYDDRHWLVVDLVTDTAGSTVNRDAIGARVTVVTEQGQQIRERDGGNGYCGQSDPRLHFGLGTEDRVDLLEVRWPDGGLQYLEDLPADQEITIRRDSSRYAARMAIQADPPRPWKMEAKDRERLAPPIAAADLERRLASMEEILRARPPTREPASRYRKQCALYDRHDRSIAFFRKLVAEQPERADEIIELACAYIDKIPTKGGIAAIVGKGKLARQSLDLLDDVIARDPDNWLALYCRAMNHLHWPKALRHSDDAAADFLRCRELELGLGGPNARSYFVRTYIGLGDAYCKDGRYVQARNAYREGLALFPKSTELRERLATADNVALVSYVADKRSLEQPIDTDLSFVDRER